MFPSKKLTSIYMQADPETIIANARQHINDFNALLLQNPSQNEDDIRRYIQRLSFYSNSEFLRDVHLLEGIWFNQTLDDNTRNDAGNLLEQILGSVPNSGILVDARSLISRLLDRILQLTNHGRSAAGGKRKRKKSRKNRRNKSRKRGGRSPPEPPTRAE